MTKSKKADFRPDDFVVYPAHGVGKIVSIEEQEIAGLSMELFVIAFEKDKMTLRVPTHKASEIGMRALSEPVYNENGAFGDCGANRLCALASDKLRFSSHGYGSACGS